MSCRVVSPVGSVYQAGTLSGNPVAMAAGITQLKILKETPEVYKKTFELGEMLRNGAADIIKEAGLPYKVTGIGSLSCIFFTDKEVTDYTSAKTSDTAEFAKYFNHMLSRGNYFGPSQFESIFVSAAHTKENIDKTLTDMKEYFIG